MKQHLFAGLFYCGLIALCYQPVHVAARDTPPPNEVATIIEANGVCKAPVQCFVFVHLEAAAILPAIVLVPAKAQMSFTSQRTSKAYKPYRYAGTSVIPSKMYHVDPGLRGC